MVDHDHARQIEIYGVCPVCATAPGPSQATLGLGEVACALGCGQPVDPRDRHTMRRMVGWAKARSAGGTHALALRQELHQFAHTECIEAVKAGRLHQPPLPIEAP